MDNKVLRETTLRESAAQPDAGHEAQVAVEGTTDLEVNTYSTTIGLIISGILKLGRIATAPRRNSQGTALAYHGIDGLDLPPVFSTPDEQGFCGGVETAFLSLSDDEAVADAYSGVAQGKVATIFELELSKGSLGAEVAWLSQFPKDQERLLPPWTHLQVVGPPKRRADGATLIRMRPTVFQNVHTVEEVAGARKEEIRAHIAGLVMDLRSQADFDWDDAMSQRPSEQTPLLHSLIQRLAFAHRLAAFEQDLLARYCKYEAQWYDDNGKYKSTFLGVLREVDDARAQLADPASALSKRLASTDGSSAAGSASGLPELSVGAKVEIHSLVRAPDLNGARGQIVEAQDLRTGRWVVKLEELEEEGRVVALKPSNLRCIMRAGVDASSGDAVPADAPTSSSSSSGAVYRLHTKFFQDPTLFQDQSKSFRAKFGSDDDFAGGMQGKLGKMDLEFVKRMYLEHNRAHDAQTEFAYGNKGKTSTAQREWRFVVGSHGISVHTWTFDVERAEPEYTPEDLVEGRNAKPLRELMRLPRVKEAGLRVAEVVGLRLYSGPLFAAYNRVQRGFAKDGDTLYTTTAHLIKSGIFKLAMITAPPADLTLYRGTGNMALGPDFFERDAQGFAGGVELGFMSATASRQVALEFAGMEAEEGKDATKQLPTLYVIDVGKMSIGANIADISQFEGEEEFVYPMLTRLELTKEPELSPDRKVSLIHLKLTVNQRSTTVEDAEQARRRFLTRLAHSLQWSLRNWARQRAGLTERLRPQIVGVLRRLLDEVRGAELAVLNTNEGYGQVFERIMRIWEEALRQEVVEALWQDGEQQADKVDQANAGCAEAAVRRFDQAIDAARELCADSKEVRDRVVEMGRVKMLLTGGGKDQERDAHAKFVLAKDLNDQGEYDEAIQLYHQVVELLTQVSGHDCNMNVAASYYGIAIIYNSQGHYERALEYHHKSLDIKIKVVGHVPCPEIAKSLMGIGNVLGRVGKYEEALVAHQKALEVFLAVYGHDHLEVAASYNNIGAVYVMKGDLENALLQYQRALEIRTRMFGSEHPSVADLFNNIGGVYRQKGDLENALLQHQRALEIRTRVFGSEHPSVAGSSLNMGIVYRSQEKAEEAKEMFTKAYSIFLKVLGPDHPHTQQAKSEVD